MLFDRSTPSPLESLDSAPEEASQLIPSAGARCCCTSCSRRIRILSLACMFLLVVVLLLVSLDSIRAGADRRGSFPYPLFPCTSPPPPRLQKIATAATSLLVPAGSPAAVWPLAAAPAAATTATAAIHAAADSPQGMGGFPRRAALGDSPAGTAPTKATHTHPHAATGEIRVMSCIEMYRRQLFTAQWVPPSVLPTLSSQSFDGAEDTRLLVRLQPSNRWSNPEAPRSTLSDVLNGIVERTKVKQQENWSELTDEVERAEEEARRWAVAAAPASSSMHEPPLPWRELFDAPDRVLRRCQLLPLLPLPLLSPVPPIAGLSSSLAGMQHLEFLRDRWFLLIGDSTDRYQVTTFCRQQTFGLKNAESGSQRVDMQLSDINGCTRCFLPDLNFSLVNLHLNGVMEAGWVGTERDSFLESLSKQLLSLHNVFHRPPAVITLQSALWDIGGFGELLWQVHHHRNVSSSYNSKFDIPVHPILPYLQRLEHYLLRPVARVFGVSSVLHRSALTSPPSSELFSDDPQWMRVAAAELGQCVWPAPIGLADTLCPIGERKYNAVIETVRRAETRGISALERLVRGSPSFRTAAAAAAVGGNAAEPLLVLRSVNMCKLRLTLRDASIRLFECCQCAACRCLPVALCGPGSDTIALRRGFMSHATRAHHATD